MRKFILLIILAILSVSSCEKDDVCLENITPNLQLTFSDIIVKNTKKPVNNLKVWVTGKDSLYINKTIDSISIPLDTGNDKTTYHFSENNVVDSIVFNYSRANIFVSRSCGYKTIFYNLKAENYSTNWIKNIIVTKDTISNEKASHITIYH